MRGPHKRTRAPRWHRVIALLPLCLLAGAWTASLGSTNPSVADAKTDRNIPSVPTTAIDEPASYTTVSDKSFLARQRLTSTLSADGIPQAALDAYRRTASVLSQADSRCHLSWALVAAIGRVESDHGRYGGSILGNDGISRPGVFGLPLDGSHGMALVHDTDGGRYDHDTVYDRAVGPMQFIPGTWNIVGVDGDGDGRRDPQDINDAAVGAGVYLCAGNLDLSTTAGQRAAVFNYNHSTAYVDLVLSIMKSYLAGDYSTTPNGLHSPDYYTKHQDSRDLGGKPRNRHHAQRHADNRPTTGSHRPGPGTGDNQKPKPRNTDNGGTKPGSGHNGNPGSGNPVKHTIDHTVHHTGGTIKHTVDPVVAATKYCTTQFSAGNIQAGPQTMQSCVDAYVTGLNKSLAAAQQGATDLINGLLVGAICTVAQALGQPCVLP